MEDIGAAYYHPPPPPNHPYCQPPPTPAPAPPHLPPPHMPPSLYYQQSQPSSGSQYSLPSLPYPPRDDEVRTLFIAGLPEDVQAREIYNLFREFPGFQSSQLRNSGSSSQAYAFAVFVDQQSAVAAMNALNGMVFDLEKESTLFIDLAKSNSRPKRSRADGFSYSSDKKVRWSAIPSRGFPDSGVGSNSHMPGYGNSAYSTNRYPSAQSQTSFGNEAVNQSNSSKLLSNEPCPTLFVANLGPTCSEQELTEVFSSCAGFLKLKMQNKNGVPVAFVDFQDVSCSTGALNFLRGTHLYSSVGEGIRLEYAKSRMGLRKREGKT